MYPEYEDVSRRIRAATSKKCKNKQTKRALSFSSFKP